MMREAQAIEWLSRKVINEGYLTIPQVTNATGGGYRRTADAIMVQTWPSRALSITGVEYKCTKADWRRELNNPEKAESVAKYCHYWLILAPVGIVPLDEIPTGWGLWEIDKRARLMRTKQPPAQEAVKALDLPFFCAILRAAEKVNRSDEILEADRLKLIAEMNEKVEVAVKRRSHAYDSLKASVAEFELASGITVSRGWNLERLGTGVAKYIENPDTFIENIKSNRIRLVQILDQMNSALGEGE